MDAQNAHHTLFSTITRFAQRSAPNAKNSTELLESANAATPDTKFIMDNASFVIWPTPSIEAARAFKMEFAQNAPYVGTLTIRTSASQSMIIVGNGKKTENVLAVIWDMLSMKKENASKQQRSSPVILTHFVQNGRD